MSKIIPNSFQTPNFYVDELLALLTSDEWKVLSYTVRRIFGFHKQRDKISLTQYERGLTDSNGSQLDYGTGLSRPAISKILSALTSFRVLILVALNDPHANEGACYALQMDAACIDFGGLRSRLEARRKGGAARTQKARAVKQDPVSGTNQPARLVGLAAPGKSDLPHPVSGTNTQKPVESQSRKPEGGKRTDLPEWLDEKVWKSWLNFRKEIRHPITPEQSIGQFKALAKFQAAGMNPNEVIEQSIANGWQGLFTLPKGNGNGSNGRHVQETSKANNGGTRTQSERDRRLDALRAQAERVQFIATPSALDGEADAGAGRPSGSD